ncbi:MAG: zinc-dependent alcohol dehydrogenase family protein [Myxococcales bacterium]|jgi:propanol-preferring alcohol dehydrogenase
MRAMVLDAAKRPLRLAELPIPAPGPDQILLRVKACAVCRTDLHIVDGELPEPQLPLVPGHEIVGEVVQLGPKVVSTAVGARLGVPWLGWSCGVCRFCQRGQENLCAQARFTGYTLPGGYAEYVVADHRFAFPIPERYPDVEAAPLLCAGLIGYRSYRFAGDAQRLGLYGFGAAAHLLVQVARHQGRRVFAFVRPGDDESRRHALDLGAEWAGYSNEAPPEPLDAAILFAPVGALVPEALSRTERGGVVVCGGIHMSDIPSFPYSLLWGERAMRSVANLTRQDALDFLELAPQVPVRVETQVYPLEAANKALAALREGRVRGAAVLTMD